ncbi:MAG: methionyl-tRNA formyltransferase [Armatimonadetes bacterium]|nr:methionyl-tRNA formyltransferase [Armatimonadota bacterium]
MKILFFGTSDFAVPTLLALMQSRYELVGVVTQPDRPRGRGLRPSPSPVKRVAGGLPVFQPEKVRDRDFIEHVRRLSPDVVVLAAFGQIIPRRLLEIPPMGPINVHASLLPKYRGAAPIQWALISGEIETGVTTMWMDEKLDTGDILLQKTVPIQHEDNSQSLTERLAKVGADLLMETLYLLEQGNCPRISQNHEEATYAPILKPEDGYLDWEWKSRMVLNRIRGVTPKPGAYTEIKDRRIKIWRAEAGYEENIVVEPGSVLAVERQTVRVATGDGAVDLVEVQPENGKRMGAGDWSRGARIQIGDRFQKLLRSTEEN